MDLFRRENSNFSNFLPLKIVNFATKMKIGHFSSLTRICSFWTKNGTLTHCDSSITHLYVITVMPLVPGRNSSPASVASVEETEDNLVLDFSNGGPPSLVISTADQPQVRLPF